MVNLQDAFDAYVSSCDFIYVMHLENILVSGEGTINIYKHPHYYN